MLLNDGQALDLSYCTADLSYCVPENLSIRAELSDSVHEVWFFENNVQVPGDGQQFAPYALADDIGGDFFPSQTLKTLTTQLKIKATPYVGGPRGGTGIEGHSLEITISIVNRGKVTYGGVAKVRELDTFDISGLSPENPSQYYYGGKELYSQANTPTSWEDNNQGQVGIALIENSLGVYIMVIYDKPLNGIGGTATVAITASDQVNLQGLLAFCDNAGECGGYPNSMTHSWSGDNTDGYAIGHFTEPTKICFDFSGLVNLNLGARFVESDGTVTQLTSIGTDLVQNQICVTTPQKRLIPTSP